MTKSITPLSRRAFAQRNGGEGSSAPIRIVHLGLGAFHRAHQAWYTARAVDGDSWGIASFTGRSAAAATSLAEQEGLYTLIERSADGDVASVISSVVEVGDGGVLGRFVELLAAPSTAIVTMTITESGYRLSADGSADLSDPVLVEDIRLLSTRATGELPPVAAALSRLVLGLEARRQCDGGPIAIVPCDNLPGNGTLVNRGVRELAAILNPELVSWIDSNVSFVSTSVDRITPRTLPADLQTAAALTGWGDIAPVVTEPFSDWVLSGDFPAGRPQWETAGARFVNDIEPFERRKLWLLNGAHSQLALRGLLRGHHTVADAMTDPECRRGMVEYWAEATPHLPSEHLDLDAYLEALVERFENPRIEHGLDQIAVEGVSKLRVRIVPVARAERAAGRSAAACAEILAAWIALLLRGQAMHDGAGASIARALTLAEGQRVSALLTLLDEQLAQDSAFLALVEAAVGAALKQGAAVR